MLKSKIVFIIPYFGRFPSYFQLFLNSCKYNPEFTWKILTDNKENYLFPDNVVKIDYTFERFQERVSNAFGNEIKISSLHKLCEYKPAYAYLFPELVNGYDFWGYCDVDLIFGKIANFIDDELLSNYNKLFTLGHFTLIRNTYFYNTMFMQELTGGRILYKEAFSSNRNYNFDEEFAGKDNINTIFELHDKRVFRSHDAICDIYSKSAFFKIVNSDNSLYFNKDSIVEWREGELNFIERVNDSLKYHEYMYIHLQKRKMKVANNLNYDRYKMIPNSFDNIEVRSLDLDSFRRVRKWHWNLQYFRIRFRNLRVKIKSYMEKEK